jgi:hypothetical protein
MSTITAEQGSQPTLDDLRIGIIDAATRDGVSKARLLLRLPSGDVAITMSTGESRTIAGYGILTLDDVVADQPKPNRPTVSLTFTPDRANAG